MMLIAATAGAQLQRTVMEQTPTGSSAKVMTADGVSTPEPLPFLPDEYVVGQRSIDVLIYGSCGLGPDGRYSGTQNGGNATPAVVENLDMDGSLFWSVETDRGAFALMSHGAMVTPNQGIAGGTVYGNCDGETWAWTHDLPSCTPSCITQTADGSVVVVGTNTDTHGEIHCFNGFTGELLSTFAMADGGWARVLDITADGSLVASRGNMLQVIDTTTGTPLYDQSAGASCDVVAISPDGHWLVAGWTSMEVYERAGDTYVLRWSNRRVNSSYATFARVNSDGDIVCGLNTGSWNRTYVYMVNATDVDHAGVLYTGPVGDGTVQEAVHSIYFGDDSDLAVLGNWGDALGNTPEVMVLEFGNSEPVAWLDTRGSIYAVDGAVDASGGLEIVACGKQTHANIMGNGGDYYIMYIPSVVANENDGDDQTPDNDGLRTSLAGAQPNPFNPMTQVVFSLDRTQNVRLAVFDLSGKLVAELADGVLEAGEHAELWNGRDMTGRAMPSGNYVISMETELAVRTAKMSLVR